MGMKLGNSRRKRDTGFQWLIIGIVLGMGCAFSFMLTLYVLEIIDVSLDEASTPQVIITTPAFTQTVEIVSTEAPTEEATSATSENTTPSTDTGVGNENSADGLPTPLPGADAPTSNPSSGPAVASSNEAGVVATPTIGFSLGGNNNTNSAPQTGDGAEIIVTQPSISIDGAPATTNNAAATQLLGIATNLIPIEGGVFKMGTTEEEAFQAVAECQQRDAGLCEQSYVTDSIPPHDVFVDDFMMEQYEVSVQQYVAFLNYLLEQNPGTQPHLTACNGPCALTTRDAEGQNSDIAFDGTRYLPRPDGFDRSLYPVTFVSWQGAKAYCEALGRYLPSEAQWERAARGSENRIYPWGFQWFNDDRANTSRSGTSGTGTWPVNQVPQGSLTEDGLANMAGNVAEWTADYYDPNLYQARLNSGQIPTNPINTNVADSVVVRGGSWDTVPLFVRTVHRQEVSPNRFLPTVGFRCAAPMP
ncbi:MAG: hypothetical protein CUN55_09555 [Phototrophicales bacterium]|nr:MAG: hypothetical protein CUN55_09555 [Phototrophicales bacterium]